MDRLERVSLERIVQGLRARGRVFHLALATANFTLLLGFAKFLGTAVQLQYEYDLSFVYEDTRGFTLDDL